MSGVLKKCAVSCSDMFRLARFSFQTAGHVSMMAIVGFIDAHVNIQFPFLCSVGTLNRLTRFPINSGRRYSTKFGVSARFHQSWQLLEHFISCSHVFALLLINMGWPVFPSNSGNFICNLPSMRVASIDIFL